MSMILIAHSPVGSGGIGEIEFTDIPQNYDDLVLVASLRTTVASTIDVGILRFNGDSSSNYSYRSIWATGTSVASYNTNVPENIAIQYVNGANSTANTFSNFKIYITNYKKDAPKLTSYESVQEDNGSTAYSVLMANKWDNTSPITSISISLGGSSLFVENSSATLYAIKSGSDGITAVS